MSLPRECTVLDDFPPASYDDWRAMVDLDLKGAPFERKLVTHTYEGIDIQPVYTADDWPSAGDPSGFPGRAPFTRGGATLGHTQVGWDLRQEHAHPDIAAANAAILEDLQGGVTSLHLRLDAAARAGLEPDAPEASALTGRDGLMVYSLHDLDAVLDDVHLGMVGVSLEAGAAAPAAAAMLAELWSRRGVPAGEARAAFNADPLAVLARDGALPVPIDAAMSFMADLAAWSSERFPRATAVRVGTAPYHHAGATAAQDLAFSMATAVEYLRVLTAERSGGWPGGGLTADRAADQLLFSYALGCNFFLATAKLRAARALWSRVAESCGCSPEHRALRMHVRTSKRVLTVRDPWVNLLRNTVCAFAGAVSGAEAITSVPFDAALGLPSATGRRIARNTPIILQEESNLHAVIDPAGGSWFIEKLTDELSEQAWSIFQEVERQGGMRAALLGGWVAEQIDSAFAPRAKNLATRRDAITGVSEFPNLGERAPVPETPDLAALRDAAVERLARTAPGTPGTTDVRMGGAEAHGVAELVRSRAWRAGELAARAQEAVRAGTSIGWVADALGFDGEPTTIAPLTPHPYAGPFEALREASDIAAESGARPRVFLANMGPIAVHTARASYARSFFEAGGFEVVAGAGFEDAASAAAAFVESRAHVAVICSSDGVYETAVAEVAPALKSSGARTVVLAGHPGGRESSYREAGVDRFIYIRCDVLQTLRDLLTEEGVL